MKNIYKALADFQQEVPVIHKSTQGYGYSYSDLPTIYEVINPLLQKHGLGFTQPIDGMAIRTILFHVESGETIESKTDIPQDVSLAKMNQFQVLGSAITYIRRYAISSLLGLVTDKDTDASGTQKTVELTDKDIQDSIHKVNACKDLKEITALYNSDVRYRANKVIVDAVKAKGAELKVVK